MASLEASHSGQLVSTHHRQDVPSARNHLVSHISCCRHLYEIVFGSKNLRAIRTAKIVVLWTISFPYIRAPNLPFFRLMVLRSTSENRSQLSTLWKPISHIQQAVEENGVQAPHRPTLHQSCRTVRAKSELACLSQQCSGCQISHRATYILDNR